MTFRKVEEMFRASRVPGVHKATGMWDVCPIWALTCTRNICRHSCRSCADQAILLLPSKSVFFNRKMPFSSKWKCPQEAAKVSTTFPFCSDTQTAQTSTFHFRGQQNQKCFLWRGDLGTGSHLGGDEHCCPKLGVVWLHFG